MNKHFIYQRSSLNIIILNVRRNVLYIVIVIVIVMFMVMVIMIKYYQ